ncbi:MAG TPA: efflux RND transporter periplasmic adaptor subunit [Steroidobacteraceae bacterium]
MRHSNIVRRCASVAVLAAATLLSACGGAAPAGRPGGGFTPQVVVVTLKAQPVTLTRVLPGRTNAYLVAEVRPQVSGIVKQRRFTEGAVVKAGQPLYELDDAPYRAQYNSAVAALQKAQATLAAARLAAERSRALVKIDAVSAQDNDNAVAAFGQAQADVAGAQAAVTNSAVNLSYAHIVAPITGRIGKSAVTQGALVTADQATAMATVQQLDPIYVDVNQPSSEWLRLKQEIDSGRARSGGADSPAKILLTDGRTYAHAGKLQFADVSVDPTTGDFLLRVIVPNPDGVLLPGMYVRAVIDEGVLPEGVLAPQQGITHDPKGNASALVVNAQGKVEPRAVKASRTLGNAWLVDSGLAAGDRLIVEGLQKVKPGMSVTATEATSPELTSGAPTPASANDGSDGTGADAAEAVPGGDGEAGAGAGASVR